MGAWGYQAYDNDEACDWLCEIEELITKKIEATLTHKSPHTLIAAAGLLLELDKRPLDLSYDAQNKNLFNRLHDALERLLTERAPQRRGSSKGRTTLAATWPETWDNPELAKQMLDILMRRLRMAELEEQALQKKVAGHIRYKHNPKGKKKPAKKKP